MEIYRKEPDVPLRHFTYPLQIRLDLKMYEKLKREAAERDLRVTEYIRFVLSERPGARSREDQ